MLCQFTSKLDFELPTFETELEGNMRGSVGEDASHTHNDNTPSHDGIRTGTRYYWTHQGLAVNALNRVACENHMTLLPVKQSQDNSSGQQNNKYDYQTVRRDVQQYKGGAQKEACILEQLSKQQWKSYINCNTQRTYVGLVNTNHR